MSMNYTDEIQRLQGIIADRDQELKEKTNTIAELAVTNHKLSVRIEKLEIRVQTLKEDTTVYEGHKTRNRKGTFCLMFIDTTFKAINMLLKKDYKTAVTVFMYMIENADKNGGFQESVRSMAASLDTSNPTIQRSLKALEELDIVAAGKVGQNKVYGLNPEYVMKRKIKEYRECTYFKIREANECTDETKDLGFISIQTRLDKKIHQEPELASVA